MSYFWKALNLLRAFQKHMTGPPFLVIEKIWSPFDGGGMSNGDQMFLVIRKGACHMFLQSLWWGFPKKKLEASLMWWLISFCCYGYHRGADRIFSTSIQHTPVVKWSLKFLNHPKRYDGDDFFINKWYYMHRYIHKIVSWGCTLSKDSNDYLFWKILSIY